jgi:signal recognition particle subunit SRP19
LRKKDKMIIWPVYFDLAKTRNEGRRVPKKLAVASPKVLEIKQALEKLGLEHELVLDANYPKTPRLKTGMLLAAKKEPKNQIIKKIAKKLSKIRGVAKAK